MSKTKAELIEETLQEVGVAQAGQTASTEDTAVVEARVIPLLEDLAARNVIYIGDSDDIPDNAFPWLVMLLAQACARKFGGQMGADAITLAESRLRTISRIGRGTRKTLGVDTALLPRRRLGTYSW